MYFIVFFYCVIDEIGQRFQIFVSDKGCTTTAEVKFQPHWLIWEKQVKLSMANPFNEQIDRMKEELFKTGLIQLLSFLH